MADIKFLDQNGLTVLTNYIKENFTKKTKTSSSTNDTGILAVKSLTISNGLVTAVSSGNIQSATAEQLGVVKVGTNIDVNDGVISVATAQTNTLGLVKTSSTVTKTDGLTAAPIIDGIVYYKNSTYTVNNKALYLNLGKKDGYTAIGTATSVMTANQSVDTKFYIPEATGSTLGLIKVGTGLSVSGGTVSLNAPIFTNSSTTADGTAGYVPAPTKSQANLFLKQTGWSSVTKADVGLDKVTNESKTKMFTSPDFTGTPTAPTATAGTCTTQIATTAFVQSEISTKIAAADAMIYKGTVSSTNALPTTDVKTGWTYKVAAAGTYGGHNCEVGDMIIALNSDPTWTVVQANIDGAVIGPSTTKANTVAIFDGTNGRVIKDSTFTIECSVPANAKFTDTNTHKTSKNIVGTSTTTTADGAVTENGVYLNHLEDSEVASHHKITGGGATKVTSDASGNITITSSDTHYTSKNIVGASNTATANAAATNGKVWLNHLEQSTVKSSHNIVGDGYTTVESDANGKITIKSSWRGIQDNLTSTITTDSLSANQGKILNDKITGLKTITVNVNSTTTDNTQTATSYNPNSAALIFTALTKEEIENMFK